MNILVFCAKGFETMEFSAFIDVMGWARNDFGVPAQTETCGFTKTVTSTFDVPIVVDTLIEEVAARNYDALAIPGGFEEYGFYDEAYDERLSDLIRDFDRQGKAIASICVGALALGKAGVLRGRRATTYHLKEGYRQKELARFGALVANERIVIDGNIITSYCPETAPYVALALLEMLFDKQSAAKVKTAMGF